MSAAHAYHLLDPAARENGLSISFRKDDVVKAAIGDKAQEMGRNDVSHPAPGRRPAAPR